MRIYRDLRLVEQLGSGIHRILKVYDKSVFSISDNFLEISFPFEPDYESNQVSNQAGNQVENEKIGSIFSADVANAIIESFLKDITPDEKLIEKVKPFVELVTKEQKEVLSFSETPRKKKEILVDCLSLSNQTKNFNKHIEPLLEMQLLQRTLPNVPKSQFQKYVTTSKGKAVLYLLNSQEE